MENLLWYFSFRCRCDPTSQIIGKGLLNFKSTIHGFGPLSELKPFEDEFFFITLVTPEAHAIVCDIGNQVEGMCDDLFSQYWIEGHFL